MFPGAFKQRWTLKWAVGRIITALVIGIVIAASNKAFGAGLQGETQGLYASGAAAKAACLATEPVYGYRCTSSGTNAQTGRPTYPGSQLQPSGHLINYLFDYVVDQCPAGTSPAADGECVEEESCDPDATFTVDLDFGLGNIVDGSVVGIEDRVTNADGCEFTKGGVSACLIGKQSSGEPGASCAITYNATGQKGNSGPPNDSGSDLTDTGSNSLTTDTETESNTAPPTTTELSDGTTKTVETTTTTTRGGGSANKSGNNPNVTMTVTKNSLSTTTVKTTTTQSPDGTFNVVKQTTTTWKNGDSFTVVTDGNSLSGSTTEGASGGGSTTTTKTENADGSSSEKTTTSGGGGGGSGAGGGGAGGGAGGGPNCSEGVCDGGGDGGGSGGDGDGEGEGEGGEAESPGETNGPVTDDAEEIGDSLGRLYNGIFDTPLVSAFEGVGSSFPSGGSCPSGTFDVFGDTIQFDGHCTLFEQIRPILAAGMRAFWIILAVVLFLTL